LGYWVLGDIYSYWIV